MCLKKCKNGVGVSFDSVIIGGRFLFAGKGGKRGKNAHFAVKDWREWEGEDGERMLTDRPAESIGLMGAYRADLRCWPTRMWRRGEWVAWSVDGC